MADIIRRLNPVPGYKGNGCRRHKWIPAILKLRGLVKIRVKGKRTKEEGVV